MEHVELNEVTEPDKNIFVGGKEDIVFNGLKEEMIERAEAYVTVDE